MRAILMLIMSNVSSSLLSQVVVGRPWRVELGASTNTLFKQSYAYNIRYISPKFNWSDDDLTEEQEKHPEQYKKARLMVELIYTPPFKVLCAGINAQYRLLKYKRLSLEAVGGLKLFFIPGPYFEKIRPLKIAKGRAWYLNVGLITQLNLGFMSPFVEFGGDGIMTIGSEFNFKSIHLKPKKRYKLHAKQSTE